MYITELPTTNVIKYSKYAYNRTNYELSMTERTYIMDTKEPSTTSDIKNSQYVYNTMSEGTLSMYTTEPSTTNGIKYSQYVYCRTISYE